MAKDPAFLFYPGDWLGGTMLMNRHHKGAYMDLLMAQYNNGHMTLQQIKTLLGPGDEHLWEEVLKPKFTLDECGQYYNQKLDNEINKRKAFTESRKKNLQKKELSDSHMQPHMGNHMENENENENENKKEEVQEEKTIIDYQFIVDNYHSLCPKMNKVAVINDQRKGFMNARVGEHGIQKVISVLRMAGESEFLNGKNDKAWKADFEWIMRPTNFVKVMEGKYSNNGYGKPEAYKTYTYDQILGMADKSGDPKTFWRNYKPVKLPDKDKPVWVHIAEIVSNHLEIYNAKELATT